MKKIVVINGHPHQDSFNTAITQSYISFAKEAGVEVRYIAIRDLNFNPNLEYGYSKRMELEPDLLQALDDIRWSDHQVWIHPIWWLSMPAILKGFFDRAFLPSIAFKINGEDKGLLSGKTARIINTAGDLSQSQYENIYKSSGLIQLKKGILEYCGASSVSTNFIGPLEELNESDRRNFLNEMKNLVEVDLIL